MSFEVRIIVEPVRAGKHKVFQHDPISGQNLPPAHVPPDRLESLIRLWKRDIEKNGNRCNVIFR